MDTGTLNDLISAFKTIGDVGSVLADIAAFFNKIFGAFPGIIEGIQKAVDWISNALGGLESFDITSIFGG